MQHTPTLPAPADAHQLGGWTTDVDGSQFRRFTIRTDVVRTVAARTVEVRTEGEQHSDGTEWRTIAVEEDAFDGLAMMTSVDARALAAALNAAADELEQHAPIAYTLI